MLYNDIEAERGAGMLTRITSQELLTTREARKKYATKYFNMHITEQVDLTGRYDKGYVLYTADKRGELLAVSRDEYKDKMIAHMMGEEAPELAVLGDIIYHE